jgi:hypothetical protein
MRNLMSNLGRLVLILATLTIWAWSCSPSQAADNGRGPGRGGGPPQEMIDACSDQSAGDDCSFATPRGEAMGVCTASRNGVLVCRPQNGPGDCPGAGGGMGSGGQGMAPPPEAAGACSDKAAGDDCSFATPKGEAMGVCTARRSGVLACFPKGGPGRGQQ